MRYLCKNEQENWGVGIAEFSELSRAAGGLLRCHQLGWEKNKRTGAQNDSRNSACPFCPSYRMINVKKH